MPIADILAQDGQTKTWPRRLIVGVSWGGASPGGATSEIAGYVNPADSAAPEPWRPAPRHIRFVPAPPHEAARPGQVVVSLQVSFSPAQVAVSERLKPIYNVL